MAKSKMKPATPVVARRILIVDDHPMLREGLRGVIDREPDLVTCAEAASADQAITIAQKLMPDLALVDITLPGKNGLELVKDLKAVLPDLAILAVSMHDEAIFAERMLRAGANGYISKHQPAEELVKAIRHVLENRCYVSSEVSEKMLRGFSAKPNQNRSPMEILTDREFEIFRLLGEGSSPKEIARRLNLSSKTVAVHKANICQKLNIKSTARLIHFAVQSENLGEFGNDD